MSELYERDRELVRSILDKQAHAAMDEQSEDYQIGVALGDQVDLAYEALDRMCAALAECDRLEEALRNIAQLDDAWVVTDNVRGTHLVKLARAALAPPTTEDGEGNG